MILRARTIVVALAIALGGLAVAGCGGDNKSESESTTEQSALAENLQAACNGTALSAAPKLPPSFPQIEEDKLTYTEQSTVGPTNIVEGYFNGDVKDAHEEFEKELKAAGYEILFNELEDHDSEISWKGEERSGQVAMREECGESDKTYIHITNRPA